MWSKGIGKRDIMGVGQFIYMDVQITKNNKGLDGEENKRSSL